MSLETIVARIHSKRAAEARDHERNRIAAQTAADLRAEMWWAKFNEPHAYPESPFEALRLRNILRVCGLALLAWSPILGLIIVFSH